MGKKLAKKTESLRSRREEKFGKVLEEFGEGKLRSGSKKGPKVKNKKQAIAIAFSEVKRDVKKKKTSRGK